LTHCVTSKENSPQRTRGESECAEEMKSTVLQRISQQSLLSADAEQSSSLFPLTTLYSSQTRVWQNYDENWALFELDHVRNECPIPPSARFLLIHLIQKERLRLQRHAIINLAVPTSAEELTRRCMGDETIAATKDKEKAARNDQVSLAVLEAAYKEARIRL